jgi:hypothetical protein
MDSERRAHLVQFYSILNRLEYKLGGARRLADCTRHMRWPQRGVYFFREPGEQRSDTGEGPRIVRVGTHALKENSATSLWKRLSQHKGQANTGGGHHRGSIFRLIVGAALIHRDGLDCPTWGKDNTARADVRTAELTLEHAVSQILGDMTFLWLPVLDEAGPDSRRGYIERNAIALLSNSGKPILDPPSPRWLGLHSDRARVRNSGLWNQNHVEETYDPAFLDALKDLVTQTEAWP